MLKKKAAERYPSRMYGPRSNAMMTNNERTPRHTHGFPFRFIVTRFMALFRSV